MKALPWAPSHLQMIIKRKPSASEEAKTCTLGCRYPCILPSPCSSHLGPSLLYFTTPTGTADITPGDLGGVAVGAILPGQGLRAWLAGGPRLQGSSEMLRATRTLKRSSESLLKGDGVILSYLIF